MSNTALKTKKSLNQIYKKNNFKIYNLLKKKFLILKYTHLKMSENLNVTVRDQIQPEEFDMIPVKGTQHGLIEHKNIK